MTGLACMIFVVSFRVPSPYFCRFGIEV